MKKKKEAGKGDKQPAPGSPKEFKEETEMQFMGNGLTTEGKTTTDPNLMRRSTHGDSYLQE